PEEFRRAIHTADLVAVQGSAAPSALPTWRISVSGLVEPKCADVSTLVGLTTSRSAVAGLMSLSRRQVATDTPSAKTKVTFATRMASKSRLIGGLEYKVNGFRGRAQAHVV